ELQFAQYCNCRSCCGVPESEDELGDIAELRSIRGISTEGNLFMLETVFLSYRDLNEMRQPVPAQCRASGEDSFRTVNYLTGFPDFPKKYKFPLRKSDY
ncbi:MAG: hypothetical protein RLO18_14715, partial [Gimesia chilikensis]